MKKGGAFQLERALLQAAAGKGQMVVTKPVDSAYLMMSPGRLAQEPLSPVAPAVQVAFGMLWQNGRPLGEAGDRRDDPGLSMAMKAVGGDDRVQDVVVAEAAGQHGLAASDVLEAREGVEEQLAGHAELQVDRRRGQQLGDVGRRVLDAVHVQGGDPRHPQLAPISRRPRGRRNRCCTNRPGSSSRFCAVESPKAQADEPAAMPADMCLRKRTRRWSGAGSARGCSPRRPPRRTCRGSGEPGSRPRT